jgi:hypothetical protein
MLPAQFPPLPIKSKDLPFLDKYLFQVMAELLNTDGADASGLFAYYAKRIENEHRALSDYDLGLFDYVCAAFDPRHRRVVHAGSGIGTLTSALAMAGFNIAGIERDAARFRAAGRIREALAKCWPTVTQAYELLPGEYPSVLHRTPWLSADTVLIFTNCASNWPLPLSKSIISTFSACGDVILDTRLFGKIRESAKERRQLLIEIESTGLIATPLATTPIDAFYHHVRSRTPKA